MAIDISTLLDPEGPIASNTQTTNPMSLVTVMREQNTLSNFAAQAAVQAGVEASGLIDQAAQEQTQYVQQRGNLAIKAATEQAAVSAQLQEDLAPLEQNREALEAGLQQGLGELGELQQNANRSFLANPFTYYRDKNAIARKTETLNQIQRTLGALYAQEDMQYAQAAQQLRRWREQNMNVAYMTVEMDHAVNQIELQKKQQQLNTYTQTVANAQRFSQQRQRVSEGFYLQQQQESDMDPLYRHMYWLQNGTVDGYNRQQRNKYAQYYSTLPAEQKNSFATSMVFAEEFGEAGIPLNRRQHMLNLAENAQDDALIAAGYLSREPGIADAVTTGTNYLISRDYNNRVQQWQAQNPDEFLAAGNKVPASVQKNIMAQVQKQYQNVTGEQGLIATGNLIDQDMSVKASANPAELFTFEDSANQMRLEGFSEPVVQYFASPQYQQLTTTGAQGPFDPATNFVLRMSEQMQDSGVPKGEISPSISAFLRRSASANYMQNGQYGNAMETLKAYGKDFNPTISVTPLRQGALIQRIGRALDDTTAEQQLREQSFNLANPQDVQNVITRARRAEQAIQNRSRALNPTPPQILEQYTGTPPQQTTP